MTRDKAKRIFADFGRARRSFLCLLVVGALAAFVFGVVMSCYGPPRATPRVTNHDARGRFFIPPCPICGKPAITICNSYRCANGDIYETADIELGDGENEPVEHCGAR